MSSLARIAKHLRGHEGRTLAQALVGARGASTQSTQSKELMDAEIEHATGLERKQLEAERGGVDMFHEAWLDAPFGTETSPVEVTSAFAERVVGVPDAEDDSTVWWGVLKAGEPPKQITDDGEFFVLKQVPSSES